MGSLDPERLLSMSAFEAAQVIRSFRRRNPTFTDAELVETVRAVRADFYPNDYEAGIELERIVGSPPEIAAGNEFFRGAIEALIEHHKPLWLRLAPGGREHVLRAVNVNGVQCFRNAGLLDVPPSEQTARWWDLLAAKVRHEKDAHLLEQGRAAERLSLAHERERLSSLGISQDPRWIAIEDNSAGYDILSYDVGALGPSSRLIEVKSSTSDPPRIVLTRGEWTAAMRFGEVYVFHIWSLPAKTLIERSAREMASHVPNDQGLGTWATVEIPVF